MGGRGTASGIKNGGVFGREKPLEIKTTYYDSRSLGGSRYKATVLDAVDLGNGVIELSYARADSFVKTSKTNKTSDVTFTLTNGFVAEHGNVKPHNLNLENITAISGQTYDVKDYLKSLGYKWKNKRWEKS